MAFNQNANDQLSKIVFGSGGYIVVTTSRSRTARGWGVPGAPGLYLSGIEAWDQYYDQFDINWEGPRLTFPGNQEPPPKIADLKAKNADGSDNPTRVLRWGGFDQPDYGSAGPIGADRPPKPPPVLQPPGPRPPNVEDDGYQEGQVIHDLLVFNIAAIKNITGKEEFTFDLDTPQLYGTDEGGGGTPGVPTSRKIHFVWGSGGQIGTEIQPLDYPVFPPANGGPTGYPNYDAIHPNYKYLGFAPLSNVAVIIGYILNHTNTGLPGGTYPPWDKPFADSSSNGAATMQAFAAWANANFNEGETFFAAEGTEYFTPNPPVPQQVANYKVTIGYYKKPPVPLPSNAQPTSPVPFFPVDPQNNPQWDLNKADQTITREWGGTAPQDGRTLRVKLAKSPTTGQQQLTAEMIVNV